MGAEGAVRPPTGHEPVYLDNAATSRPAPEVCELVGRAMREYYGNPSSLHTPGIEAERAIGAARAHVAAALGVEPDGLYFTSGGTEANNAALFGIAGSAARAAERRIVSTRTEHPSVLRPLEELAARGFRVSYIGVDARGRIDLSGLERELSGDVALIALTHVNNETGTVQPIEAAARLRDAQCPSAFILADCVQSFGKLRVQPRRLGADIVTMSAHKLHGPRGVGALYAGARARARLRPLILGGGQENGMRSGTENTPAICGFGEAARLAADGLDARAEYVSRLGGLLRAELADSGLEYAMITPETGASPYILAFSFPGVPAEVLLNHLSREGIYVSSGSACSARRRDKTGSHVLNAMGLDRRVTEGAIRVSFSRYSGEHEVAALAEALKATVPTLAKNHSRSVAFHK